MSMRIALVGATGMVGSRIAAEATRRGHHVTPLGRAQVDVLDAAQVARAAAGHDALVSAYGPPADAPRLLVDATRALIEATRRARIPRLLTVGGAGSLLLPDGRVNVDTWPADNPWRANALAHRDALELLRASDVAWTVATAAGAMEPGARTGRFRLGGDTLVGESRISAEDFAVAILDELERPRHLRARFSVGS